MILFSDTFYKTISHGSEYYTPKQPQKTNVTSYQAICQRFGGYLAEINTEAEYTFLFNFLKTNIPEVRGNIVGATDCAENGKWVYLTSGKPVTFTGWYQGEIWKAYYGGNMGCRGQIYRVFQLFLYMIHEDNILAQGVIWASLGHDEARFLKIFIFHFYGI